MDKVEIYKEIFDTYKRHQLPVDKFGNLFLRGQSSGFYTVDKLMNPSFKEIDFVLAKLLSIEEKIDQILEGRETGIPKRRGRPPKTLDDA